MRKRIILPFFLILTLMAVGCGKEDVRGDISNTADTEVSDVFEEKTEESAATEEVEVVEEELALGSNDGNVYESKFIGIGYQLDEDWSFYTDEQIMELNNATADLAGEEYQEMLKDAEVVYDMFAVDENGLDNINVNLEKVNPIQLLALDIVRNYETVITMMQSAYENMGYSNFEYEICTINVDGKEVDAVRVSAEINDVQMYQVLFMKKCSGYAANIAVTTYFEDATAHVLDNIYWLD